MPEFSTHYLLLIAWALLGVLLPLASFAAGAVQVRAQRRVIAAPAPRQGPDTIAGYFDRYFHLLPTFLAAFR